MAQFAAGNDETNGYLDRQLPNHYPDQPAHHDSVTLVTNAFMIAARDADKLPDGVGDAQNQ